MSDQIFHLMHKNDRVRTLAIDTISGEIKSVSSFGNDILMPLGTINDKKRLNLWWQRRAVPMTRKHIPAALRILNQENTSSLLVANLGLSLTDHYWINPADSPLTWEEVNLFENEFTDILGDFQFTQNPTPLQESIRDLSDKTSFIPSASLQGELQKKWVIGQDGERALVKGNYGASYQQSLNEVFATLVHEKQGVIPFTRYTPVKIDTPTGTTVGCYCRNFASNELEFISAYDINSDGKKPNDMSEYEYFIQQCSKYGLDEHEVRKFMEYQLATDFILTNTDRHFNNFGVLRDSKTLKFVSMAPIFDTGNSMFWNTQSFGKNTDLLDIPVTSFLKKEAPMLKYITNSQAFDINKLPSKEELRQVYNLDPSISKEKMSALCEIYDRKIAYYQAFQNGKSLSEMQRKGLGKLATPIEEIWTPSKSETHQSKIKIIEYNSKVRDNDYDYDR